MRKPSFWIGLALSVLFLYLAFKDQQFSLIVEALSRVEPVWLLLSICGLLLSYLIRAWRWWQLIAADRIVPYRTALSLLMMGLAANNVLPLRGGELVRAIQLGRLTGTPKSFGLGTIVVEKVFDMIVISLMLLAGLCALDLPDWVRDGQQAGAMAVGLAVVVIVVLAINKERAAGLVSAIVGRTAGERWGEKASEVVLQFVVGLSIFRAPRRAVAALLLSLASWTVLTLATWSALIALGADISAIGALFVEGALQLAGMVPSSPGYVGIYEYISIQALAALSVPAALALAFSLVFHLMWLGIEIVFGGVAFLRSEIDVRQLKDAAKTE